jgi:Cu/Ag efflux protein CusF
MKTSISALLAAAALGLMVAASASHAREQQAGNDVAQADKVHQGKGTVESVDLAAGVVTMEHEAIESLRWPKMVMDFKAHDPSLLKSLKEGDRVDFDLVKMGKEYHITRIAPVR